MKRHTSIQLRQAISLHPGESRREWILELMGREGRRNSNNAGFQLWRQDNHPTELNDEKKLHACLDYIHENPAVAGIVEKAEDYLYSSARNYNGLKGLIEVELIDPILI